MHFKSMFGAELLFCLSLLAGQVAAIDPNQLGIQIDERLAPPPGAQGAAGAGRMILGSIVQIPNLSTWTSEQITGLAFSAHASVDQVFNNRDPLRFPGFKKPSATTTLIIDNTAYISTSMVPPRGQFGYIYTPNGYKGGNKPRFVDFDPAHPCGAVGQALLSCQLHNLALTGVSAGHRTGAMCGEPMAALAFCAENPDRNLDNAKIVTINGGGKGSTRAAAIVPPCSAQKPEPQFLGEWGCQDLVGMQGFNAFVIPVGTVPQNVVVDSADITITHAQYP